MTKMFQFFIECAFTVNFILMRLFNRDLKDYNCWLMHQTSAISGLFIGPSRLCAPAEPM